MERQVSSKTTNLTFCYYFGFGAVQLFGPWPSYEYTRKMSQFVHQKFHDKLLSTKKIDPSIEASMYVWHTGHIVYAHTNILFGSKVQRTSVCLCITNVNIIKSIVYARILRFCYFYLQTFCNILCDLFCFIQNTVIFLKLFRIYFAVAGCDWTNTVE